MVSHPQTLLSRKEMARMGLAGYVVPSTDAHQVAVETCFSLCSSPSMWLLGTSGEPGFLASLDPMGNNG